MHDNHTLRLYGLVHVVGDKDNGDAEFTVQLTDNIHDLTAALRVEHGGRLIEYNAARHHGDNACDCDSLLLSAGQTVRRLCTVFVHADGTQCIVNALADLCGRHAHVLQRKCNIFFNNGSDKLVVRVLEHHRNSLADLVGVVFVAGVHHVNVAYAAGRQTDRVEAAGKRTLARAVVTEHRDELAALDGQVYAFEHRHGKLSVLGGIGVLQVFGFDDFTHGFVPFVKVKLVTN